MPSRGKQRAPPTATSSSSKAKNHGPIRHRASNSSSSLNDLGDEAAAAIGPSNQCASPPSPSDDEDEDDNDDDHQSDGHALEALAPLLQGGSKKKKKGKTMASNDVKAAVEVGDGKNHTRKASSAGFARHADAVWERNEEEGREYVPRGFMGIFSNYYVALCASFSALGGLIFGYDQGVVSIVLVMPQFLSRFETIDESHPGSGFYKGLMTAMIELGALIGALNQGWIADKYSRKYSIVAAVVVFTVGSALQTGAVDYPMLVVARLIGGVGIGMLSMVAPLYISEISPPEIRGSLLVLEEFSIVTGIVIAFWITYGTQYIPSEWSWRLPFLLQMVPGFVLGAGILFLPFSPRWLVSKGRDKEALTALAKLRQTGEEDERVQQEWLDIRAEVAFHREMSAKRHPTLQGSDRASRIKLELASWADCFRKGCWRRTHVGMGIMFFQQFVGINALIYYSPTLFQTMGLDHSMQLIMSGVLNVTQLVGVTSSLFTMDRFGRRTLLLWGSVCMTIAHIVIAVLVGLFRTSWPSHKTEGWVSVAFLLIYMLGFGASWGPVPWALPSEIFPSSLRGKGVALSTASNWFNNFIIGLITPPLVQNRHEGAYVFFAVFCLASFAWTYFFVPETSGRTLEQMDMVFKDASGEIEERRRTQIEEEIVTGRGSITE